MTALVLARQIIGRHNVVLSDHSDRYDPLTGKVYLSSGTALGGDCESLMIAAHECAHRLQHQRRPWTRRRRWRSITPILMWLEWQAWVEAFALAKRYISPDEHQWAMSMKWLALGYL